MVLITADNQRKTESRKKFARNMASIGQKKSGIHPGILVAHFGLHLF